MNKIEQEFNKCESWYRSRTTKSIQTGKEMIVQIMLDNPDKIWWWSWEFVGKTTSKGDFLSHRAPARASDMAIYYPDIVEDRAIGRFKVYRLRTENIDQVKKFIS